MRNKECLFEPGAHVFVNYEIVGWNQRRAAVVQTGSAGVCCLDVKAACLRDGDNKCVGSVGSSPCITASACISAALRRPSSIASIYSPLPARSFDRSASETPASIRICSKVICSAEPGGRPDL